MKIIKDKERDCVLRLDIGEKWPDEFIDFCNYREINSAFFKGLGGFIDPEIAFYDLEGKKEYIKRRFNGIFELLSLIGNVSVHNGSLVVHAHAVLGKDDYSVIGGHLVCAEVGGTLELYVNKLDSTMERRIDNITNLNLLH